MNILLLFGALLAIAFSVSAQNPGRLIQGAQGRFSRTGMGSQGQADSLQHRTGKEDSITIRFRFLDSSRLYSFDSSVMDFTDRFPVPWDYVHLGNLGNPAQPLLFKPNMMSGWDPGFHSLDIYNFRVEDTRFFTTTRPYAEIGYLLGSVSEQMIHLMHTQNIRPNWNASFQYRMINSPGTYQNQNTNHNSYRFTSWYQSRNKRYQNFFVLVANKLATANNGGIRPDGNYLDSVDFLDDRFKIPTQLGQGGIPTRNFFGTSINTGTFNTNATYLMRQQYDIGQKDSIQVNDTTIVPLFYPRLRFEHTISYHTLNYRFKDYSADSVYYRNYYNIALPKPQDSVFRRDYWRNLENDFSIYQFPDAKNPQQFIKLGATYQYLKADFDTGTLKKNYSNLFLHGEYRNKTRNKKWDIEALGNFYLGGLNSGDYRMALSLQRLLGTKTGFLKIGFENVNRNPSFVFRQESAFYLDQPGSLNKENSTYLFASLDQPKRRLSLFAGYYLLSNYTYISQYYQVKQISSLFNVLQVTLRKSIPLGKHWNWRTWIYLQQKTGAADLNIPSLVTRNQLAYDGNLGFKNLLISFGGEFRYFTPYKATGYSAVTGQFYFQDSSTVRMKLPEIGAYVHFRIRSFVAYVRTDNLNTLNFSRGNFTNNNMLIPGYPYPGMQIRVGIFWSFVN